MIQLADAEAGHRICWTKSGTAGTRPAQPQPPESRNDRALNRPHELRLHIRGALNNASPRKNCGEVFLQIAVYCGVPAGLDSFRNAKEVFTEMGISD